MASFTIICVVTMMISFVDSQTPIIITMSTTSASGICPPGQVSDGVCINGVCPTGSTCFGGSMCCMVPIPTTPISLTSTSATQINGGDSSSSSSSSEEHHGRPHHHGGGFQPNGGGNHHGGPQNNHGGPQPFGNNIGGQHH